MYELTLEEAFGPTFMEERFLAMVEIIDEELQKKYPHTFPKELDKEFNGKREPFTYKIIIE